VIPCWGPGKTFQSSTSTGPSWKALTSSHTGDLLGMRVVGALGEGGGCIVVKIKIHINICKMKVWRRSFLREILKVVLLLWYSKLPALFQETGRDVRGNLVKEDVLGLGIVYCSEFRNC